ncbi:RDD family protein [Allonocardiopsis opalescens]|uniref:Putative RDD family membrane protein YckC n=1 Tax=Allonocardiopsis opalescens TaxID=1144618 RepID=A0A2T0PPU7_9ACTN|nr:RDD family protein [Allonocardiopsis opalescens]PRX90922.1 putative RDD family membrane protein YckC [Allonocardiopsis opalescens]
MGTPNYPNQPHGASAGGEDRPNPERAPDQRPTGPSGPSGGAQGGAPYDTGPWGPYQPPVPDERRHAGALAEWWQRLIARIIDGVIALLVFLVVGGLANLMAAAMIGGGAGTVEPPSFGAVYAIALITGIIGVAALVGYEYVMLRTRGQTLGKMALRLRVVELDAPGRPPGLSNRASVVRALVWWGPAVLNYLVPVGGRFITMVVVLVNGLWPLWDRPNRQSLNDKAARTAVIVEPSGPAPGPVPMARREHAPGREPRQGGQPPPERAGGNAAPPPGPSGAQPVPHGPVDRPPAAEAGGGPDGPERGAPGHRDFPGAPERPGGEQPPEPPMRPHP